MGIHAFERHPEHCEAYLAIKMPNLPVLAGIDENWNMPVVRHSADLGPEARFPGVDHYVMTLHLGGASVQRLDWAEQRPATTDCLSLQAPGSAGTFRFGGRVDYAHLYFKQSLLCEVGDEIGIGTRAEIADFFGRSLDRFGDDASTYIRRALDDDDPPTALEMDSRAYLLADSLLRSVLQPARPSTVRATRNDIRQAIELIEADISAPLRLSDLANAAGLSVYHFARVFRAAVGETPAEYVMRRRTEWARDLIVGTEKSLGAIAYEVGFSSQSHMNRHIRQRFATTPTALRAGNWSPRL